MAVAARARELTVGVYVTDDKRALLCVVKPENKHGAVMVEDALTYDVYRIKISALDGWRTIVTDG